MFIWIATADVDHESVKDNLLSSFLSLACFSDSEKARKSWTTFPSISIEKRGWLSEFQKNVAIVEAVVPLLSRVASLPMATVLHNYSRYENGQDSCFHFRVSRWLVWETHIPPWKVNAEANLSNLKAKTESLYSTRFWLPIEAKLLVVLFEPQRSWASKQLPCTLRQTWTPCTSKW